MPFDPVRGVGYEPKPNPAVIQSSEDVAITNTANGISTLTVTDDMNAMALFVDVALTSGTDGNTTSAITLRRNEKDIALQTWSIDVGMIKAATGSANLFAFNQQYSDLLRKGDNISVRIVQVGVAGASTYTVNISVIGAYV